MVVRPELDDLAMKYEKRRSPLDGFEFKVLDDPEFREDSVREELISPILRGLRYSVSGTNRIIRSRRLLHPFVSIGTQRKPIHIIPDYLLEVNGRNAWILDAKAPTETLLNTRHVEQAYSYAIHSEVRVPYYALCNGRDFVLFHVSKSEPVVQFPLAALAAYWDNLVALLGPEKVLAADLRLKKDFGLHLKRLGFDQYSNLIFPGVPVMFVGKMGENHFMFGSGIKSEDESYVVTFDFDKGAFLKLKGKIPEKAFQLLLKPLEEDSIRQVQFADRVYFVTVDSRVGKDLVENEDEIFLPLWVNRFL